MSLIIASESRGAPGNDAAFQARLVSLDATGTAVDEEGNAIKQSDLSALTCTLYDLDSGTPTTGTSITITIAGAISNTLVNDNYWTRDTVGRNFIFTVPGANFSASNHRFHVVFQATTTGGRILRWAHRHTTQQVIPAA